MATLYIAEFAAPGLHVGSSSGTAMGTPIAEQTVAIGGTTTASSAFNGATALIRVHTDAICSVALGTGPTATAAKMRLAANQTEYFSVPQNQAFKIAVITNT